ncbi:hypothetical protein NFI96_006827 [Prochilodus magdalenae]|nr:hypothetical protein NFI96_006827 [Prochilodus magdalenae]
MKTGMAMVLLVPAVVVVTAGIFYLYGVIIRLLNKTSVRNKVVLITDSVSALGNECAKLFHKGGARLILCGKSWEKLEALAEQLANESDPTLQYESEGSGADLVSGHGSGHILLVNSIQGKLAVPFRTTYAASKHAVQAFFDCLRAEVQDCGICVSTLSHTFIKAAPSVKQTSTANSILSVITRQKPHGISPEEMANELLKVLSSRKNEIIMAHSISKAAIYARSFFPNFFFAVMAAGVRNTAAMEQAQ